MKKRQLKLKSLKVQSFTTSKEVTLETVKGGTSLPPSLNSEDTSCTSAITPIIGTILTCPIVSIGTVIDTFHLC